MSKQSSSSDAEIVVPCTVLGVFETVDFPEFGIFNVRAKIDTGAYSGAFHCTDIKLMRDGNNNKVLSFVPFGHKGKAITVADYHRGPVQSSNGMTEVRYFVDTKIIHKGVQYPITLSLSNRDGMKNEVLIGRKFLRKNKLMVDPSKKTR